MDPLFAGHLDVFQGASPLATWKGAGECSRPRAGLDGGGGGASSVRLPAAPNLLARGPTMDPVHVAALAVERVLWAAHAQLSTAMRLLLNVPVEVHVVKAVFAVINRGPHSDHVLAQPALHDFGARRRGCRRCRCAVAAVAIEGTAPGLLFGPPDFSKNAGATLLLGELCRCQRQ